MTYTKQLSAAGAVLIMLVGAVLISGMAGCGEADRASGPELGAAAKTFDSDVPPMNPEQKACPVCGNAIKENVYVDVDDEGTTKRIYFDSDQCKQLFQQNMETELMKFKSKMQAQSS